jgi:glucuronate isomerase
MKSFFDDEFLLNNKTAILLYNQYAKDMPIFDYHCHLSPQEIAENKTFYDIGELMLKCDHYKWRIMRLCGIDEELITGKANFKDKFIAFAKVLSFAIGNPIYHWTHMELKEYFGINEPLNEESAERIYEQANKLMVDGSFSARDLIEKSNVYFIGTTDDPADDLLYHKKIKEIKDFKTKIVPTFRPDLACNIAKDGFFDYIKKLGNSENKQIKTFEDLLEVLQKRLDLFEGMGCRIADHGIENIPNVEGSFADAKEIFEKKLDSQTVSSVEAEQYLFYMLTFFAGEYEKRNFAMQIHLSVIRNQNTALFNKLGADCGIDSVGDVVSAKSLGKLFDTVERESGLPKIILYTLNPSSYYVLSTMLGNFAGKMKGKMQLGSAWWFCDHRDGITEQLKILANTGALGQFIGMLTDSRSFVSYTRHHYFRRILCSLLGEWAENGEIPSDEAFLEKTVKAICFNNAQKYFEMG